MNACKSTSKVEQGEADMIRERKRPYCHWQHQFAVSAAPGSHQHQRGDKELAGAISLGPPPFEGQQADPSASVAASAPPLQKDISLLAIQTSLGIYSRIVPSYLI